METRMQTLIDLILRETNLLITDRFWVAIVQFSHFLTLETAPFPYYEWVRHDNPEKADVDRTIITSKAMWLVNVQDVLLYMVVEQVEEPLDPDVTEIVKEQLYCIVSYSSCSSSFPVRPIGIPLFK